MNPPGGSQPLHQAQSQVGENRPLAEATVRREPPEPAPPQAGDPEAPSSCTHKVNLMLADKLQQAGDPARPRGLAR